ncbi:MAG: hypothetical protein K6A29_03865 [Lachnospiraceae bacterium]|nr:hypothetical protein [Lachnospiraceae bacterium]
MTNFNELVQYVGMHKLPKGFTEAFSLYEPDESKTLIDRDYYNALLAPYNLSKDQRAYLDETLDAIEKDEKVLLFSKFFVWDMCSMRNKYDIDNYTELIPSCLGKYNEAYAFVILLACVPMAEKEMLRRGIPKEYYEDIPHRMIRDQLSRYIETGKIDVLDMPWKLNFYTLTIFLLDRFLFIPYQHGEGFSLYRSKKTGKVVGIPNGGTKYDAEGQLLRWGGVDYGDEEEESKESEERIPGSGYEYSERKAKSDYVFTTDKTEENGKVTGYYMNPVGFTEERRVTLDLDEYECVLKQGDFLIALHIPGGEGYTPERMHNSMELALDFFKKYYPEHDMKGFWSSSWLYDKRLEFIIGKGKNITNVQNLMFRYSDGEDGSMLYVHLYKTMDAILKDTDCKTTLQKGAKERLLRGERFLTTGMMILKEEALNHKEYFTKEDELSFYNLMEKWGMQ